MAESRDEVDRLIAALDAIDVAAAENVERSRLIQRRARRLRKALEKGAPLAELLEAEQPPRTVELLTANMTALETSGAELRATTALTLRAEGLTIEAIAELFGVTRQRISALLRQRAAQEA